MVNNGFKKHRTIYIPCIYRYDRYYSVETRQFFTTIRREHAGFLKEFLPLPNNKWKPTLHRPFAVTKCLIRNLWRNSNFPSKLKYFRNPIFSLTTFLGWLCMSSSLSTRKFDVVKKSKRKFRATIQILNSLEWLQRFWERKKISTHRCFFPVPLWNATKFLDEEIVK